MLNHSKLPKTELIERSTVLEQIMSSPFFHTYVALTKQMDSLSVDIHKSKIKFGSGDDKSFNDFIKYVDKVQKLAEAIDYMKSRLTPEERKKAETEKLKAKPTQVEANTKEAFMARLNKNDD